MEKIKKIFLQKLKIDDDGVNINIVPDGDAIYNVKVLLTSDSKDLGYFDVDMSSIGVDDNIIIDGSFIVSGESNSRLSELRKYKQTSNFIEKYIPNGGWLNNGVDYLNSIENVSITYYIDGIKYVDNFIDGVVFTTYSFYSLGYGSDSMVNGVMIKNPEIPENIISRPKKNIDVNIVRGSYGAFEKNYYLKWIKNMRELYSFLGGKYYKIFKV